MKFIETIGEYKDGEKLDMFINLDRVKYIIPNHDDSPTTLIDFDDGERTKASEPYLVIREKIRQASQ